MKNYVIKENDRAIQIINDCDEEIIENIKKTLTTTQKIEELDKKCLLSELNTLTKDEILNSLRDRRYLECFTIINRGILWYNLLTDEQRLKLDKWYREWLDITDTYRNAYEKNSEFDIETIIPIKPTWLK